MRSCVGDWNPDQNIFLS